MVSDDLDASLRYFPRIVFLRRKPAQPESSVVYPGTYSGGRLSAHGRACSKAAAARRTVASAKRRPTIWSPTGSRSRVNPHGTEALPSDVPWISEGNPIWKREQCPRYYRNTFRRASARGESGYRRRWGEQ